MSPTASRCRCPITRLDRPCATCRQAKRRRYQQAYQETRRIEALFVRQAMAQAPQGEKE